VVGRAAVFNKVNLESELFKRETLYKNIHSPDHIVLTDRFFERYRKEVNLISVYSLDEFHVIT
jgi:hypothetical protein